MAVGVFDTSTKKQLLKTGGKSKVEKCGEILLNKEKGVTPYLGLHRVF